MEKTFWDRIEEATSGKYTRKMLAIDSNVSISTIGMWITRKSYPTADAIVRVAEALGTTVEYLVTGKGPEPPDRTDYMMAAEPMAQGYADFEYKQVIDDLKILDKHVRAGFITAIHHTAECIRREKNRQGGSAVS